MLRRLWRLVAPVVAIALLGMVPASRADSINASAPVVTGSGPYTWTYALFGSAGSSIVTGDFFVIVDFGGLIGGSNFQPVGWTFSTETTTGTISSDAGDVSGYSDGGLTNLRWTYSGAPIAGPSALGPFGAISSFNVAAESVLVARDHNPAGTSTGANIQPLAVPVPLPAAVWAGMSLMGLMGAQGLRRKRQQEEAELA